MPRLVRDQQKTDKIGQFVQNRFEKHKKDRNQKEIQWLRNMRQERGVYDPETEKKFRENGSRAYPKLTRLKVRGTISRMMEMMFPQSDKNYQVGPSSVPNLLKDDLDTLLQEVQAKNPEGSLTDEQIEEAIRDFARKRAGKMELEIDDTLEEISYIEKAREVVKSGVIYGLGVLMGPMVEREKVRTWVRDANLGTYKAIEKERLKPVYEPVRVWDYYPDMTVSCLEDMEWEFLRKPISRTELLKLKKRADYIPGQIDKVIARWNHGNYVEEHWEQALRANKSDKQNININEATKFELIQGWGWLSSDELEATGAIVPKNMDLVAAWVVTINNVVVKAELSPYDRQRSPFHKFIFNNDDLSLLGTGLPEDMRDSQLAICDAARMLLDNASAVCGPMLEMDLDLLLEGQDLDPHAFKVYLKEGGKGSPTNAGNQAVRNLVIESHMEELMAIIKLFMDFADQETALPPPALGDIGKGGSEALRTTRGASMLLGAAALPIRDIVRNFDKFTVSVITALYDWLMEFRDKPDIKGDFQVIPKGSTSLIAKEVRAQQLLQLTTTFTEAEREHVNERKTVVEKMKASDLPLDMLDPEKIVEQKREAKAKAQQEQEALVREKVQAEIKERMSKVVKNLADSQATQSDAAAGIIKILIEAIGQEGENEDQGKPSGTAS